MHHTTNRYPLKVFLLLSALLIIAQPKCVNSTEFKYDLTEVSSITGYHALCSEHTGRTCCSRDNFEQLNRKISRVLGSSELTHQCKRSLTNLLCMPCDGDIGQQLREGVCGIYCQQLFNQCYQDYFAIDSNNQLRGCRDQDIICSKLSGIISDKGSQTVCQLFQLKSNSMNCWNGEISAVLRGKIPAKQSEQNRSSRRRPTTKTRQQSSGKQEEINKKKTRKTNTKQNKQETAQPTDWVESAQNYLSLLGLFLLIFVGLFLKKIYKKWKRQYRHRR